MKKFLSAMMLVLCAATIALAASVKPLSPPEARTLIDRTPNLFILDVRTPDEFRQARIKKSVLIPDYELEKRVSEVPKNRPVLVVCAVGARSQPAADFLARRGYQPVYHLNNGLVGWYRAGFPVEK